MFWGLSGSRQFALKSSPGKLSTMRGSDGRFPPPGGYSTAPGIAVALHFSRARRPMTIGPTLLFPSPVAPSHGRPAPVFMSIGIRAISHRRVFFPTAFGGYSCWTSTSVDRRPWNLVLGLRRGIFGISVLPPTSFHRRFGPFHGPGHPRRKCFSFILQLSARPSADPTGLVL